MPFLQFTRDKRGYETTSLVHAFRGRHGRSRQKVLYWFRTPPNVKVGRPALDEEAIRWIEEHNPEIEFDWPKILEATPPPAPLTDEQMGRRSRRVQVERRAAQRRPPPRPPQAPPVVESELDAANPLGENAEDADEQGEQELEVLPDAAAPEEQALAQLARPDVEEILPLPPSPIESLVGREQLIRLRARYAELQARITERGGDAGRSEALRAQAEALNPDAWVTVEDAKAGLEGFDQKTRDLRAELGLRSRRRSRRGGRHRRGGRDREAAQAAQTSAADPSSNSRDEIPMPGATGGADDDELE